MIRSLVVIVESKGGHLYLSQLQINVDTQAIMSQLHIYPLPAAPNDRA
jgi:hypothetical protein